MRIAILSQWFAPEPASIPIQLSEWLAERGHTVKVLTGFPNYPTGKTYDGYRVRLLQRERRGAVEIFRVPLVPSHSTSALGRSANFLSFAASAATIGVAAIGPIDVTYAYHPPATIGFPASMLKMFRGAPFLLHVQDLWPESAVDSGLLGSPRAALAAQAVLSRASTALYRTASRIVTISEGFRETLVDRGAPPDRTSVVYNWADERFPSEAPDLGLARRLGIGGRLVLMYAGNLGPFQGLDTAIRAAHALSDLDGFQFVIAGTGIAEPALRRLASDLGVTNVLFLGQLPKSEMPRILPLASVHLVSLRDSPALAVTIPGKIPALLAAAQPVILAGRGDAAGLVNRSGAGWVCDPDSPQALAMAIREVSRTPPAGLRERGQAGRSFYMESLSLDSGASKIESLLRETAQEHETCV